MTVQRHACLLSALLFGTPLAGLAQQPLPSVALPSHGITISVAVDTKSDQPATSLNEKDFTILDNKTPRPITSFRVVTPPAEPVHVILLLDAVNMPYEALAYTRQGIERYLKSNEGTLAYPTTLAILTDHGVQIANGFSTDGNRLNDSFHNQQIGLREINRASEWSGAERLQICIDAFRQLASFAGGLPGRKAVIWISAGWPLVSGPRIYLDAQQEDQIFNNVVLFSNQLRQDEMTVYNVNPWGVGEALERADYYEAFLKAPARPNDVQLGDLAVQVLAIHTGGLAIESNSDVTGNIARCLADFRSWYQIVFDPLPADKPNEYHHIEVHLDQRDLVARTTDGYYANQRALDPRH
jgi:VWFA-related protein